MERELPTLLTAVDVATWLTMTTRLVERLARSGKIPSVTLPDGSLAFEASALAWWLDGLRASGRQSPEVADA